MADLPDIRVASAPLQLDGRPAPQRVGLLALATDHTSEADFRRLVATDARAVHVARVAYANPTTPENLRRLQPRLTEGAGLILPDEALDAIYFACTSASVVIGDDAVERALRVAKPEVPVVTPILAARRGLRTLGARRISVLTPYTAETTRPVVEYLHRSGFEIASCTCFGMEDDRDMARISPGALVEAARHATAPDAEALFVSCTALRSAAAIPAIEEAIARPAIASNQAGAWLVLRTCGDGRPRPEHGRLMACKGADPDHAGTSPW